MKKKEIYLSIGALFVVALLFTGFRSATVTSPVVSAVSSPDLSSPYFSFGGVRQWAGYTSSLTQASTTVCAIQSPAATSTLISASVQFALASTTAVVVDLAKNTTPYATTTKIGTTYSVAGSAQASIVASSTGSVAGDATIFAPNNYFVVKMDNGLGGTGNVPTGSCGAIWREL